jgi:hypothetical protein
MTMDIGAGIQAVTVALDIAKGLRAIDKAWDQVALKAQMIDLMDALVTAKAALVDAQAEANDQAREIERIKAAFIDRSTLAPGVDGYKYRADDSGDPDGYPACPHCEAVNGRILVMVPDGHWERAKCPACQSTFDPVHPYNSEGERRERAQRAREQKAMTQANRTRNSTTGY